MDADREKAAAALVARILDPEPGELCPTCRRSIVHVCAYCGMHLVCAACQRIPWDCTCIVL